VKIITQKLTFIFTLIAFYAIAQSPSLQLEDSNNNFIQWNDSSTLIESNPNFTIEMWIKASTIVSGGTGRMIYCEGLNSNLNMFRLFASTGKVYVRPNGVSGAEQLGSTTTVFGSTAVWHHIAVVGTTPGGLGTLTTLRLYIDGVEEAVNTYTRNTSDYDRTVIGNLTSSSSQTSTYAFDGEIDELRLWSKALTPSELGINNCNLISSIGLAHRIRFNEASCTTVYDEIAATNYAIQGIAPNWTTNNSECSNALTAYYPFNGNANDESVNNNDGTVTGALLTADRFGNSNSAYVLNGTNQYIEIPDANNFSISSTSKLSISVWMRPDVLNFPSYEGDGYVHWMGKGVSGQHEWVLRMYNENHSTRSNRTSCYAFNLTGGLGAGSYVQETVSVGEWIHYVVVYDFTQDTIQWYKNGQLEDTDTFSGYSIISGNGTAPVRIGTRDFNSYFKGGIDDIRFYSVALTSDEVSNLYNEDNYANLASKRTQSFKNEQSNPIDTFSNELKVYPNPTKEFLNIKSQNNLNLNYTLFDAFGRLVKGGKLDSQIDLRELPQGVYYLSIKNKDIDVNKKIIKN